MKSNRTRARSNKLSESCSKAPFVHDSTSARYVRGSLLQLSSQRARFQSLQAVGLSGGQSVALPTVDTVEGFQETINSHDLIIVDFMARWCRKCIYLKPKLEKMLRDDFPGLPILFIDVNAVPSEIIKTAGIKKMPTIQLYSKGKRGPEHIAAEGAIDALEKIKVMILNNTDMKLPPMEP